MQDLRVRPLLLSPALADHPVAAALETLDFERLLEVPVAPADERAALRYGTLAFAEPGRERVYVRSASLDFNLVRAEWLAAWGRRRFFSLGAGLADGGDVPWLLLAQAFDPPDGLDALTAALEHVLVDRARGIAVRVDTEHGRACLKLAATLDG